MFAELFAAVTFAFVYLLSREIALELRKLLLLLLLLLQAIWSENFTDI